MTLQTEKHALLQNIHLKLTFLFTSISGLVLIVMTLCYLYMSEKELKTNSWLSFLSESNTMITNMNQQQNISHSWLTNISANGNYLLALYDNDLPLLYTTTRLSEQQQALAESVLSLALQKADFHYTSSPDFAVVNTAFSYIDTDKIPHYVNVAKLGNPSAPLYVVILLSTEMLRKQLVRQRFYFLFINIISVLLLFVFSYFYTRKLLIPIKENQEKQNAFIAAASHELRTPLAVILSCINASHNAKPYDREQFLQTIELESKRMSSLVNDMLTLARADNQSWTFHIVDTELDTLVLNCFEAFLPLAQNKNMALNIQLPEDTLPTCPCDRERITQVLSILLSNAFSYGKKNGYVKLALRFTAPDFYITVEDNGMGISKEAKAHIFDRFYREDTSRSQKEHFGLGLCIAKEIMDAHHGSIQVTDTPGGGSTFTIILRESLHLLA